MTLDIPQTPVPTPHDRTPKTSSLARSLVLSAILLLAIAAGPRADVSSQAPNAPAATPIVQPAVAPPAPVHAVATPATLPARSRVEGAEGLSPQVLAMALDAVACARARGVEGRDDLLTVIDYSLPSTQPRLWVLDLAHGKVLYRELVAHGSGSGDNFATRFSNVNDSKQTSLGLFRTGGTYEGGNGYSLKLQGLDRGFNDRAEQRHIVIHGAWYVSPEHAREHGRIGRSWGCPALPLADARPVIDTIKGGSFVFSYGPDTSWRRAASSTGSCGAPAPGAPATLATALIAR